MMESVYFCVISIPSEGFELHTKGIYRNSPNYELGSETSHVVKLRFQVKQHPFNKMLNCC